MSFEPEWNVSSIESDVVTLGLYIEPIKQKIKTYVDTVGWNTLLHSLLELASSEPEIVYGLNLALQAYKDQHNA